MSNQPPVSSGHVSGTRGARNEIKATFSINGTNYEFKASFMVAIINADFTSGTATLTYDDEIFLTTRTSYITGFFTKDGFDFLICKGVRIGGDIPVVQRVQTPGGPAELPLQGHGEWSGNATSGTSETGSEQDTSEPGE